LQPFESLAGGLRSVSTWSHPFPFEAKIIQNRLRIVESLRLQKRAVEYDICILEDDKQVLFQRDVMIVMHMSTPRSGDHLRREMHCDFGIFCQWRRIRCGT
jgi:hypothetical protein